MNHPNRDMRLPGQYWGPAHTMRHMRASAVGPSVQAPNSVAGANRALLHDAGVLTVGIIGGPGCGKTTLITSTIERLAPA